MTGLVLHCLDILDAIWHWILDCCPAVRLVFMQCDHCIHHVKPQCSHLDKWEGHENNKKNKQLVLFSVARYVLNTVSQCPLGAGELECLKTCAFKSDLDRVVLEMPNDSGKGTTDADISSLRALFHEMEEEEIVDCTLNGHEVARAPACGEGAAADDSYSLSVLFLKMFSTVSLSFQDLDPGSDYFEIKPKPTPVYFQWSPPSLTSSCKYTSLANVFSEKAQTIVSSQDFTVDSLSAGRCWNLQECFTVFGASPTWKRLMCLCCKKLWAWSHLMDMNLQPTKELTPRCLAAAPHIAAPHQLKHASLSKWAGSSIEVWCQL